MASSAAESRTNRIIKKLKLLLIPCEENKYRPPFLKSKFLFYCVLSLFILKLVLILFTFCFPKSVFFSEINKITILNLTNQERQSIGLAPLTENQKLDRSAYLKAQDMLENDYFNHTSPNGVSPWYWFSKVGYDYQCAGENLAMDFVDSEEVNRAWDNSPSHRKNIINPKYEDIGIAVVTGDFKGRETTVVVQFFGCPAKVAVNEDSKTASPTTSTSIPKTNISTPKIDNLNKTGGLTLYSYYIEKGEKFPSFQERASLFEEYELGYSSTYNGTAKQNTALLNEIIEAGNAKPYQEASKEEKTTQEPEEVKTQENIEKGSNREKELTPEEIAFMEETQKKSKEPIFPAGEIRGVKTEKIEEDSFRLRFFNFMVRYYDSITQKIFLTVLLIVFISMCLDIFIKVDIQYKDLILRGIFYIFVLLSLFLLDKELIIQLIPHNLIIR